MMISPANIRIFSFVSDHCLWPLSFRSGTSAAHVYERLHL
jgi:hypothetical protein